jgi:WD40 repeat protein
MKTHLDAVTKDPVWMDDDHKVVWNVRWSPDGGRLAAVGTDGTLSVYDASTGDVVHREHAKPLYGLDWSPDGRLLAAGSGDHQIYVYDAADGTPYDTLVGHDDLVTAVAWSPDGRTLASTAGGQLHSPALTSVVLGPDMNVRLWARE